MEVMGVVAVMVNLALLGMGGSVQRMFPNMTVTDRIILIVVLEVSLPCYDFLTFFPVLAHLMIRECGLTYGPAVSHSH